MHKSLNTEDVWAITIGVVFLLIGLLVFALPDAASADPTLTSGNATPAVDAPAPGTAAATLAQLVQKPGKWTNNPVGAIAGRPLLPGLAALLLLSFGIATRALGVPPKRFALGFLGVFALSVVAYICAGQVSAKNLGVGYAAWAIALGMLISNTVGTPAWLSPGAQAELFIKSGLVLLGAEVVMTKVLAIGLPGLCVAWVVTPVVLISTYWFGQRILKITSRTLNITISADMSVCGVSAAIATAAACNAKREELTIAIGLSMVFTSVMMVLMPLSIQALGLSQALGGAWLGGTLDATGAVAAAGAFLGDGALTVAATIKMIQNLLIGVVAFGVAIYFARTEGGPRRVGVGEIWKRFPKFVLGFVLASIVFSILDAQLSPTAGALVSKGSIAQWSKPLRGWCFCLAFVSIGLLTNFRALRHRLRGGKPLILYACGQSLNIVLTFAMAYLMFEVLFPEVGRAL